MQVLKCKWHDWRFCSESAACLTFPKISKLKKYTYTIENKKIYLTIE
jgi:nitrite reductase/ring-hydroxylating ferredoxin subunit